MYKFIDFNNWFDDKFAMYSEIVELTNNILASHYDGLKNVKFPVDIRGIVAEYSIKVFNGSFKDGISHGGGYLNRSESNGKWSITLNYNDSESEKRYYLAVTFCRYLLMAERNEKILRTSIWDFETDMKNAIDKFIINTMAAFLLCPYWMLFAEYNRLDENLEEIEYYAQYKVSKYTILWKKFSLEKVGIPTEYMYFCVDVIRRYNEFLSQKQQYEEYGKE